MISAVIHLFFFEVQHIAWACHNTQAASLAPFRIHYYGSMNFCHKRNSLKFKRLLMLSSSNFPQKYCFLGTWQAKMYDYLPTISDFFRKGPKVKILLSSISRQQNRIIPFSSIKYPSSG